MRRKGKKKEEISSYFGKKKKIANGGEKCLLLHPSQGGKGGEKRRKERAYVGRLFKGKEKKRSVLPFQPKGLQDSSEGGGNRPPLVLSGGGKGRGEGGRVSL